ncbi:MAG: ATP-dependent RecD-like DNA helicase [Patescibacteria group bacterium]|jgi:exodeoxyribonuclease-5
MDLTPEQQLAHDHVIDWYHRSRGRYALLTFGGLAGTGKTTTLGYISRTLSQRDNPARIAFVTFTGKASTVLAAKVRDFMGPEDYCGTIHGLMYTLVGKNDQTRELYFEKNTNELPFDLIIVDEASMVNKEILNDLAEYGIPILAVGDHGQLPPVKANFNLMDNPQIKLETIVRQAEGNPIIQMARAAREKGAIEYGDYGHGCIKTRNLDALHAHPFEDINSIMLCALNSTRNKMNSFARQKLGITDELPQPGEPLICLLNNRKKMIFNGSIGILKELQIRDDETANITLTLDDRELYLWTDLAQFGKKYLESKDIDGLSYFDWAYMITTWKSQGSEWKNVLLVEEYLPNMTDDIRRRFLYTACTRAKERLVIFKR